MFIFFPKILDTLKKKIFVIYVYYIFLKLKENIAFYLVGQTIITISGACEAVPPQNIGWEKMCSAKTKTAAVLQNMILKGV